MNYSLLAKKALRIFGLEVKRYNFLNAEEPLLKKLMNDLRIQTVIDVGANEGQYGTQLIKNGFTGNIFSFEPLSDPFSVLQRKAKAAPNWNAINCAIGEDDAELSINVSENSVSSSFYEVSGNSLKAEPATRIVRKETIGVTSIDKYFKQRNLEKEIWLKLDVQGYELNALKGALQTLRDVKAIQVELSLSPAYIGAPLLVEVVSFIEKQNYEIFTLLPGFRDEKSGRLVQADGIFLRKS